MPKYVLKIFEECIFEKKMSMYFVFIKERLKLFIPLKNVVKFSVPLQNPLKICHTPIHYTPPCRPELKMAVPYDPLISFPRNKMDRETRV